MMMKSDVKPVTITADTVAADDDGISANAAVGNNAALTIGGALASGGSVTLDHARKVTITSSGNDSSISFTIVGTDVNGDDQTEELDGANAGTATSSNYFLTIASITAVGNPAANVKAGISDDAADVVFGGRSRLKGANLVSTATAGTVDILTTSPSGTSVMKLRSVASATASQDVTVPECGVLFTDGIYVQYTVSTFHTATFYHA